MMYSLDEVGILPSSFPTQINSRKHVNCFTTNNKLPVFVAPMTCIINEDNFTKFSTAGAKVIIPRKEDNLGTRLRWCQTIRCAFSLSEFKHHFVDEPRFETAIVLIDVANGHMQELYNLVKAAKLKHKYINIMVGNIAHPDLYYTCYNAGVDYVRVGIGGGNGCLTSVNTGVHASMHWLLTEIKKIQETIKLTPNTHNLPKVVADGGIDTIAKMIKCLALGADYVMCGKLFAECNEACGEILPGGVYRLYYGMASEKGKKDLGSNITNIEGCIKQVQIKYPVKRFLTLFEEALRSAMSYTGCFTLEQFKNVETKIMSLNEFKAFDK